MKFPIVLLGVSAACMYSQSLRQPNVEFDLMTWAEVKKAIHDDGFINAVVYNGGTEQRGPQNVNGGHNFMARETARAIYGSQPLRAYRACGKKRTVRR